MTVRVERSGVVTTVIIDRPAVKNAVDRAHFVYVHGAHTMPESTVEADGPILRCQREEDQHHPTHPRPSSRAQENGGKGNCHGHFMQENAE